MPEQQDKELSFDQASGLAQLMLSSAQLPAGGHWKLCYCANFVGGCDDDDEFGAKLGFLTVYGPNTNGLQVACTAGQACAIQLVGYISVGDWIGFMSNDCGVDARDPSVAGDAYHPLLYSSGTSTWDAILAAGDVGSGGATERGGTWHICYCSSADGAGCNAAGDYTTRAGILTLYGPLSNQDLVRLRCVLSMEARNFPGKAEG
eukprot:s1728_g4.t1